MPFVHAAHRGNAHAAALDSWRHPDAPTVDRKGDAHAAAFHGWRHPHASTLYSK